MTLKSLCALIRESFHEQWECTTTPEGSIRVRTPFIYPDGDILDLFVLERAGGYQLTDFGETVGWLRMRSGWAALSPKRRDRIKDACQTHGIVYNRGQLELSDVAAHELPRAVVRLAAAAARVSDLWFTFPSANFESAPYTAEDPFREQVERWFREWMVAFKPRTTRPGRSGRSWSIDYETNVKSRRARVFLLSSSDREEAQRLAEHVFVACVDLSRRSDGQRTPLIASDGEEVNVSLFDDTHDVWREEDLRLLGLASKVVHRSKPEEFERALRTA